MGMTTAIREISREIYDRAIANNGNIVKEDIDNVWTQADLYGYGVYSYGIYEKDGKCYVRFSTGTSCD